MSIRRVRLTSPDATQAAARALASHLVPGDAIGLVGDLGAGKTCFVQGLARGLGVPDSVRVTSPTFTLINEHRGGRLPLFHVDLYRIDRAAELDHIGLDDLFAAPAVVAVEWCDRFPVLPDDHLRIELLAVAENQRALDAEGRGARGEALARAWAVDLARG
jgi:tRNA threonylcarbamoyladenosine biosynthesis protein TsaE